MVTGARISTVPEMPKSEEALTRLAGSARNALESIWIRPPLPATAFARIWLPPAMTNGASRVRVPPTVSAPPATLAVS